jgi:hypothetical protein
VLLLIVLVSALVVLHNNNNNNNKENFENYDTITSSLGNSAGFYSMFFFLLNHYIYCKENKKNFVIESDQWIFKSKNGWEDYFEPVKLQYNDGTNVAFVGHNDVIKDYPLIEYKNNIKELYIYNKRTNEQIQKINQTLKIPNDYDSIFIRRGDKLGQESKFIKEDTYINRLLKRSPNCRYIYLQTDDYNCFIALQKYIEENGLNIEITTLCDPNSFGVVVHDFQKDILKNASETNSANKDYLNKVIDKLNNSKSVENMNSDEKYKHLMDMIVGIDICLKSRHCVTDYQSNVSRFIKLAHNDSNNVYDVSDTNDIDYNKLICPAYSF